MTGERGNGGRPDDETPRTHAQVEDSYLAESLSALSQMSAARMSLDDLLTVTVLAARVGVWVGGLVRWVGVAIGGFGGGCGQVCRDAVSSLPQPAEQRRPGRDPVGESRG